MRSTTSRNSTHRPDHDRGDVNRLVPQALPGEHGRGHQRRRRQPGRHGEQQHVADDEQQLADG